MGPNQSKQFSMESRRPEEIEGQLHWTCQLFPVTYPPDCQNQDLNLLLYVLSQPCVSFSCFFPPDVRWVQRIRITVVLPWGRKGALKSLPEALTDDVTLQMTVSAVFALLVLWTSCKNKSAGTLLTSVNTNHFKWLPNFVVTILKHKHGMKTFAQ